MGGIPNQHLKIGQKPKRQRIIFQLATIKFPRAKNGGITQFNQPLFEAFFNRKILQPRRWNRKIPTSNGFSPVRKGIRWNKRLGNESGFLKIHLFFFKRKIMFQACNSFNDHWTKQRQYQRFDGSFIRITYMKSPQKISIWFINLCLKKTYHKIHLFYPHKPNLKLTFKVISYMTIASNDGSRGATWSLCKLSDLSATMWMLEGKGWRWNILERPNKTTWM